MEWHTTIFYEMEIYGSLSSLFLQKQNKADTNRETYDTRTPNNDVRICAIEKCMQCTIDGRSYFSIATKNYLHEAFALEPSHESTWFHQFFGTQFNTTTFRWFGSLEFSQFVQVETQHLYSINQILFVVFLILRMSHIITCSNW